MQFDLVKKNIEGLLNSKKRFVIPRFQREYSWETLHVNEFLDDIIGRIKFNEETGKLVGDEYFWGTALFIGNFDDINKQDMEVVDGQQRLTTITIFLSVLTKTLLKKGETDIAKIVWSYIISHDHDGQSFAILRNETPSPYFQWLVQKTEECKDEPVSEEERRIKRAYSIFETRLTENKLKESFVRNGLPLTCDYVAMLKSLRDQLLNSVLICTTTSSTAEASMIFEILNAKGKPLEGIDLIKNQIFKVVNYKEPNDDAKTLWEAAKKNLLKRGSYVDFSTFFHHYWLSKYEKVRQNSLFTSFKKSVKSKNPDYLVFLTELKTASEIYLRIISPQESDFEYQQQFLPIIEALKNLVSFRIVQSRVALLALFSAYEEKRVTFHQLKKLLLFMERFHFVYNAVMAQRTSPLEKLYSQFAIDIRNCNSESVNFIIDQLIDELRYKIPKFEAFKPKFSELVFSKRNQPKNSITRYAIQTIGKYRNSQEVVPNDRSMEHIADEDDEKPWTQKIGNIIMLETKINSKIPANSKLADKLEYYKSSGYQDVTGFVAYVESSLIWDESEVNVRSEQLAEIFYYDILGMKRDNLSKSTSI